MQSDSTADDLTDLQRHALRLGVAGMRPGEIAVAVGVDPATVSRWRRLPAFREALVVAQREADADAVDELRALRSVAVATLRDLLGPDVPGAVRLAAARDVLARTGAPPEDVAADMSEVKTAVKTALRRELSQLSDEELFGIAYGSAGPDVAAPGYGCATTAGARV